MHGRSLVTRIWLAGLALGAGLLASVSSGRAVADGAPATPTAAQGGAALAADGPSPLALTASARACSRSSRKGWAGEEMPPRLSRGASPGVYSFDTGRDVAIEMVYVAPGAFVMGSDERLNEQPRHLRDVPYGYYIGRFETTRRDVRAQDPSLAPEGAGDLPAVDLTWGQAAAFCAWAGLRLPTEAEWEKAARGTDGRVYPWGDEWDATRCNAAGDEDGFAELAPVGSFPSGASPCGAHDMAGNAWEWCADWYRSETYKEVVELHLALPGTGTDRVFRGGCFRHPAGSCRASNRFFGAPDTRYVGLGVRPALTGAPAPR